MTIDPEEEFQLALSAMRVLKKDEHLARRIWLALPGFFAARGEASPDDVVSMIYRLAAHRAPDYRKAKVR